MVSSDSAKAIGAVTKMLDKHLTAKGFRITVGKPKPTNNSPGLNLFLYEVLFDAALKNVPLDESQTPPLWLVLRYLMTPFDDDGESDTYKAHERLGEGIRALQELSSLPVTDALEGEITKALKDNPEVMKIIFDESSSDLLSKLFHGYDEKYRLSMTFQVSPVMIGVSKAPTEPPFVDKDVKT